MTQRSCSLPVMLAIGCFLSTCVPSLADDLPTRQRQQIDKMIARVRQSSRAPGISVAVATESELRFAKAYGVADAEQGVPVTVETRFRTASIAKPMTAAVVMSLAEEGLVDLDAEVQQYCPDYPRKRWPLTSRHLLAHLGGVRHYQSESEAQSTRHFFNLDDALRALADDPLKHEPGTQYLYSTFGFNLLGSVAEAAGEQRFHDLLQERVFTPAGMTHTVVDDHFVIVPDRTRGYLRPRKDQIDDLPDGHNWKVGEIYNAPLHDTSMKIPGGGLLSTPTDLIRFGIAMNTGRLVGDDTREQMWTRQRTSNGEEITYGLGWRVGGHRGRKIVWHTGGQAGTSTVLLLVPETRTCVSIMCNLQGVSLKNVAAQIADVVQPPPPPTDYTEAIEKLQAAVRHEVQMKELPAFSISLVDVQQVVWADGYGFQDADQKVPATAQTVYRVGSVSKLLTDIAVLQLVDDGRLDLDAPVSDYLPEFEPQNPYDIPLTLRQMMSHRSGLVRESPVGHYFDPDEPTLAATVASLNDTSLIYKPETKTKYSNAAIAVVGAVLEAKLGESHPDRVRRTILDPLGMTGSSFIVTPAIERQLATGWMRTYDGRRFQAPTFLLGTGPAGNLYSSASDLSKFLACLFNDGRLNDRQIVKPETLELMATPITDENGQPQGFGLGFHVQQLDGYRKIGHGGAVYGFSTQLEALPERKLGVAAASALDGTNGVVRRLADYALRLMIAAQDGEELPTYRTTGPVPSERARELIGMYREQDGERFTRITELDGDVFMQRGSYRYELRAAADDGSIITDDEIGFGTEVKLEEGDRLTIGEDVFQRLPDEPPADVPDRWKGLIGEYGWEHNTLYILEERGQLYALIEWFYYYPLKEIDENQFEFPDYGLYHGEGLIFARNDDGVATEVVAAEVKFVRREVGTKDGETFKITPVKPIEDLRAGAMAASPPPERGEFRDTNLVDLMTIESTIQLDIRYATKNNFTGAVFYKQPRAFMQRPAAEAVGQAHLRLEERSLGLLIHDAYRPWFVTRMFWDATPTELKDFVANPAHGSRHNRGCAVDLTLFDLANGQPVQMVAGYDEFSPRSFPLYPGGTSRQRWYRDLLRRTMEEAGFTVYEYEWWHFDYRDWQQYRIGNVTFEDVSGQ